MADIINFPNEPTSPTSGQDLDDDTFIRDEGLDLLAYYRSIKDKAVRASIMTLLQSLALSKLSNED